MAIGSRQPRGSGEAARPWLGAAAALRHRTSLLALVEACHQGGQGPAETADEDGDAMLLITRGHGFLARDAPPELWCLLAPPASVSGAARQAEEAGAADDACEWGREEAALAALFMPGSLLEYPWIMRDMLDAWQAAAGRADPHVDVAMAALFARILRNDEVAAREIGGRGGGRGSRGRDGGGGGAHGLQAIPDDLQQRLVLCLHAGRPIGPRP